MWNNFVELAQEPSYKRLALAVLISALVHAVLFNGMGLSLPFLKKEIHTIEARIQLPKAAAKQVEPQKSAPEVEKPAKPPKPKPEPKPKLEPLPEPPAETVPEPEVIPEPVPHVEPEKTEPEQAPQPKDEGLVINESAYQYVETYFDVSTKIDGPVEGNAKIVFDVFENNLLEGKQYQLKSLIEAKGFAAVFLPDLLQTSNGLLTKRGLQPQSYLYQFGDKANKTRKAVFDWQANTVQLTNGSEVNTVPLLDDTQDVLSFMYQFMYVAPLEKMQLNITNGKRLREYDYAFEGDENVNSALGEVKSVHIAHTGLDADEKIELWLAIDYQYLPVKIRKIDKNGKIYEFVATRIVTTRPTIDTPQQEK